ncbi:MAG: DEAD/DEAH box helicase [Limnochordaceae bacterium]|nr:DEAD/DEAH box helicase [Limnochordaceae bacterium]
MATWKAYDSLFRQAMTDDGSFDPFPYQRQLAQQVDLPAVLRVPTGAGKTAAVITAWLWRRHTAPEITPRRLVYTLPMRVLVEQTADTARSILRRLGLLYEGPPDPAFPGVRVAVLMGGEIDEDWWVEPERETILVGTLDMLLSRALNRGYALSRYRWPVDFGLLNSDALWVFDEVQLLGVGLYTGLQLQALRRRLGTFGRTHTLWCSATVDPAELHSVDHPAPAAADVLALGDADRQHQQLRVRLTARKTIHELVAPEFQENRAPPGRGRRGPGRARCTPAWNADVGRGQHRGAGPKIARGTQAAAVSP